MRVMKSPGAMAALGASKIDGLGRHVVSKISLQYDSTQAPIRWVLLGSDRFALRQPKPALTPASLTRRRQLFRATLSNGIEARATSDTITTERRMGRNMRKFAATEFVKVEDLRDGPRQETIAEIVDGKFERLDIIFESGARMGLNGTNTLTLCNAYGDDDEDWIGRVVELFVGTICYQGMDKEVVLVRPISPPIKRATSKETKPRDDVPF